MSEQQATVTESKILREVAEEYIDSLLFSQAKSGTVKVYLRSIQLATDYFGAQCPVDSITPLQIGRFYASNKLLKLANGQRRSEVTVKQIKRVFRQCMQFALAKGFISELRIPKAELRHARK